MLLHHLKRKKIFRAAAWITLAGFVLSAPGGSAPPLFAAPAAEMPAAAKRLSGPEAFHIPSGLGEIRDFHFESPEAPFVVYIQDAHAVLEAQERIRDLIGYLRSEYGIRLIALEGAKENLDPLLLRAFPDDYARNRVLRAYLERGEISGPEAAAVADPGQGRYAGIEEWNLYERNYGAYQKAVKSRPALLEALKSIKASLEEKRKKEFTPELNAFHQTLEAFYEDGKTLVDLVQYLGSAAPDMLHSGRYPLMSALNEAVRSGPEKEESLRPVIAGMAEEFRKKHLQKLSPESQARFNAALQSFLTSSSGLAPFLRELTGFGNEAGLKPELTPALIAILRQEETLSSIRGTRMLDELDSLLEALENRLAGTEAQREILRLYRGARLLKNLGSLEISRQELADYQNDPEIFLGLLNGQRELLFPALEFYETALQRDLAFQRRIRDLMVADGVNRAVVVAGGFHSDGLQQAFRDSGYSYAVITPALRSIEGHEHYAPLMQGGFSFAEQLKTTYYDAFMTDAVSQLAGEIPAARRGETLKLWRDEVLRELAAEGRIHEAGDYTRYVDALAEAASRAPSADGRQLLKALEGELARAEENAAGLLWKSFEEELKTFTQRLSGLIRDGKFSAPEVDRILNSAAAPSSLSLVRVLDRSIEILRPSSSYTVPSPVYPDSGKLSLRLLEHLKRGIREEVFTPQILEAGNAASGSIAASLEGLDRLKQALPETGPTDIEAPSDEYVAETARGFIRETMERTGLSEADARKAVYLGLQQAAGTPASEASAGGVREEILRAIERAEEAARRAEEAARESREQAAAMRRLAEETLENAPGDSLTSAAVRSELRTEKPVHKWNPDDIRVIREFVLSQPDRPKLILIGADHANAGKSSLLDDLRSGKIDIGIPKADENVFTAFDKLEDIVKNPGDFGDGYGLVRPLSLMLQDALKAEEEGRIQEFRRGGVERFVLSFMIRRRHELFVPDSLNAFFIEGFQASRWLEEPYAWKLLENPETDLAVEWNPAVLNINVTVQEGGVRALEFKRTDLAYEKSVAEGRQSPRPWFFMDEDGSEIVMDEEAKSELRSGVPADAAGAFLRILGETALPLSMSAGPWGFASMLPDILRGPPIGIGLERLRPGTQRTKERLKYYYLVTDLFIDILGREFSGSYFRQHFGIDYEEMTLEKRRRVAELLMWTEIHESDELAAADVYGGLSNAVSQSQLIPGTLEHLWKSYPDTIRALAGLDETFEKPEGKTAWRDALVANDRLRLAMAYLWYHNKKQYRISQGGETPSFYGLFPGDVPGMALRWAEDYHTEAGEKERSLFLSRFQRYRSDAEAAYRLASRLAGRPELRENLRGIFDREFRKEIEHVVLYMSDRSLSWPLLNGWLILPVLEANFPNAQIEIYAPENDLPRLLRFSERVRIRKEHPGSPDIREPSKTFFIHVGQEKQQESEIFQKTALGRGVSYMDLDHFSIMLKPPAGDWIREEAGPGDFYDTDYENGAATLTDLGWEGLENSKEVPLVLNEKLLSREVLARRDLIKVHPQLSEGRPILFINTHHGGGVLRRQFAKWESILIEAAKNFDGYIIINEGPTIWREQQTIAPSARTDVNYFYQTLKNAGYGDRLIRAGENDLVRLTALLSLPKVAVFTEQSGVAHLADWMRLPMVRFAHGAYDSYMIPRENARTFRANTDAGPLVRWLHETVSRSELREEGEREIPFYSREKRENIEKVVLFLSSTRLSWPLLDNWLLLPVLESNFPNAEIEIYAPHTDLPFLWKWSERVSVTRGMPRELKIGDPSRTFFMAVGEDPLREFWEHVRETVPDFAEGRIDFMNLVADDPGTLASGAALFRRAGFEGLEDPAALPVALSLENLGLPVMEQREELLRKFPKLAEGRPVLFINAHHGIGHLRQELERWEEYVLAAARETEGYIIINQGPVIWDRTKAFYTAPATASENVARLYQVLEDAGYGDRLIKTGHNDSIMSLAAVLSLPNLTVLSEQSGVVHLADWMNLPMVRMAYDASERYNLARPDSIKVSSAEEITSAFRSLRRSELRDVLPDVLKPFNPTLMKRPYHSFEVVADIEDREEDARTQKRMAGRSKVPPREDIRLVLAEAKYEHPIEKREETDLYLFILNTDESAPRTILTSIVDSSGGIYQSYQQWGDDKDLTLQQRTVTMLLVKKAVPAWRISKESQVKLVQRFREDRLLSVESRGGGHVITLKGAEISEAAQREPLKKRLGKGDLSRMLAGLLKHSLENAISALMNTARSLNQPGKTGVRLDSMAADLQTPLNFLESFAPGADKSEFFIAPYLEGYILATPRTISYESGDEKIRSLRKDEISAIDFDAVYALRPLFVETLPVIAEVRSTLKPDGEFEAGAMERLLDRLAYVQQEVDRFVNALASSAEGSRPELREERPEVTPEAGGKRGLGVETDENGRSTELEKAILGESRLARLHIDSLRVADSSGDELMVEIETKAGTDHSLYIKAEGDAIDELYLEPPIGTAVDDYRLPQEMLRVILKFLQERGAYNRAYFRNREGLESFFENVIRKWQAAGMLDETSFIDESGDEAVIDLRPEHSNFELRSELRGMDSAETPEEARELFQWMVGRENAPGILEELAGTRDLDELGSLQLINIGESEREGRIRMTRTYEAAVNGSTVSFFVTNYESNVTPVRFLGDLLKQEEAVTAAAAPYGLAPRTRYLENESGPFLFQYRMPGKPSDLETLEVIETVGEAVGKLHSIGIHHGDLATDRIFRGHNVFVRRVEGRYKAGFIDFEFSRVNADAAALEEEKSLIESSLRHYAEPNLPESVRRFYRYPPFSAAEAVSAFRQGYERGKSQAEYWDSAPLSQDSPVSPDSGTLKSELRGAGEVFEEADLPAGTVESLRADALRLMDRAREVLGEKLQKGRAALQVERKLDQSLVTEADTAIQEAVLELLMELYPDHYLLGEEALDHAASAQNEANRAAADFVWILDPIDGTSEFAAGTNYYGISLALYYRGRPVLALLYSPEWGATLEASADREGAFLDGAAVDSLAADEPLPEVLTAVITGDLEKADVLRETLRGLAGAEGVREALLDDRARSIAVHTARLIAGDRQYLAANLRPKTQKLWDIAASVYLVEKAGGRFYAVENGERVPLLQKMSVDVAQKNNEAGYHVLAVHPSLDSLLEDIYKTAGRSELRGAALMEAGDLLNLDRLIRRAQNDTMPRALSFMIASEKTGRPYAFTASFDEDASGEGLYSFLIEGRDYSSAHVEFSFDETDGTLKISDAQMGAWQGHGLYRQMLDRLFLSSSIRTIVSEIANDETQKILTGFKAKYAGFEVPHSVLANTVLGRRRPAGFYQRLAPGSSVSLTGFEAHRYRRDSVSRRIAGVFARAAAEEKNHLETGKWNMAAAAGIAETLERLYPLVPDRNLAAAAEAQARYFRSLLPDSPDEAASEEKDYLDLNQPFWQEVVMELTDDEELIQDAAVFLLENSEKLRGRMPEETEPARAWLKRRLEVYFAGLQRDLARGRPAAKRSELRSAAEGALAYYDLPAGTSLREVSREKNHVFIVEAGDKKYVLKNPHFRNTPGLIAWEAALLDALAASGVRVSRIVRNRSGAASTTAAGRVFALYEFAEGQEFGWGEVEGDALDDAARTLARLHFAADDAPLSGDEYTAANLPPVIPVVNGELRLGAFEEMHRALTARGGPFTDKENFFFAQYEVLQDHARRIREQLTPEAVNALPKTTVMGDYHQGNAFYREDRDWMLTDFEFARRPEARIYDLANGFLVRYQGEGEGFSSFSPEKITRFLSAYQRAARVPLTPLELDLFPHILRLRTLEVILALMERPDVPLSAIEIVLTELFNNLKLIDEYGSGWAAIKQSVLAVRSELREADKALLGRLGLGEESLLTASLKLPTSLYAVLANASSGPMLLRIEGLDAFSKANFPDARLANLDARLPSPHLAGQLKYVARVIAGYVLGNLPADRQAIFAAGDPEDEALAFILRELLKNAVLHGNLLDLTRPVYLYFGPAGDDDMQIRVFDSGGQGEDLRGLVQPPELIKEVMLLGGEGKGTDLIAIYLEDAAAQPSFSVVEESGVRFGEAVISVPLVKRSELRAEEKFFRDFKGRDSALSVLEFIAGLRDESGIEAYDSFLTKNLIPNSNKSFLRRTRRHELIYQGRRFIFYTARYENLSDDRERLDSAVREELAVAELLGTDLAPRSTIVQDSGEALLVQTEVEGALIEEIRDLETVRALGAALGAMHGRGVRHGDLYGSRAQNLRNMIAHRDEEGVKVRFIDFEFSNRTNPSVEGERNLVLRAIINVAGNALNPAEIEKVFAGAYDAARSELRTGGALPELLPELDGAAVLSELEAYGGNIESVVANVWMPAAREGFEAYRGALREILKEAVLGELVRQTGSEENAKALAAVLFDDGLFGGRAIALRLGERGRFVDADGLSRGLKQAAADILKDLGRGETSSLEALGITNEMVREARILLSPVNRMALERAYEELRGERLSFSEQSRLVMDLFFLGNTPAGPAEEFIRQASAEGGFELAFSRGSETSPGFRDIFRIPGMTRRVYGEKNPLELEPGRFAGRTRYILVAGTPVEVRDEGEREQPGVFVPEVVYLKSGLEAPEFSGLMDLVWQVEYLREQLEDAAGAVFPRFTENVLVSVFQFIHQLARTRAGREAIMTSA